MQYMPGGESAYLFARLWYADTNAFFLTGNIQNVMNVVKIKNEHVVGLTVALASKCEL